MDHLPEKRMRGLQRVLAKALDESKAEGAGLRDRILDQALGKAEPKPQYGSFDLNEDTLSRILKIAEEKTSAADLLSELLALSTTERERGLWQWSPGSRSILWHPTLSSSAVRRCFTLQSLLGSWHVSRTLSLSRWIPEPVAVLRLSQISRPTP